MLNWSCSDSGNERESGWSGSGNERESGWSGSGNERESGWSGSGNERESGWSGSGNERESGWSGNENASSWSNESLLRESELENKTLFSDSELEDKILFSDSESEDDLPLVSTRPSFMKTRKGSSVATTQSSIPIRATHTTSPSYYPIVLVPCPILVTPSHAPIFPLHQTFNRNRTPGPLINACCGRPIRQMAPVENELAQLLYSFKTNDFMERWWALQQKPT
jgi:hypothetical protein